MGNREWGVGNGDPVIHGPLSPLSIRSRSPGLYETLSPFERPCGSRATTDPNGQRGERIQRRADARHMVASCRHIRNHVGFRADRRSPGMSLAELDVKVVDDTLILRGAKRWERDVQGENFHRLESAYGKFERTFKLSQEIDADRITAELRRRPIENRPAQTRRQADRDRYRVGSGE